MRLKNTGIALLILSAMFAACEDTTSSDSQVSTVYYQDANLAVQYPFVESGSDLVFYYHYVAEQDDAIADDEFANRLYFQLPSGKNAFDLGSEDLKSIPFHYSHSCFCAPIDSVILVDGNLKADKVGDNWKLEGSLNMKLGYRYTEDSITFYDETTQLNFGGTYKLEVK